MSMEENPPHWAEKAKYQSHKPELVEIIPETLHELGQVFFPIPPLKKGWNYPHSLDEYRYEADDEIINAYLETGWGYGIACDGDLAVIDIDDKRLVDIITAELPSTAYQWTGSGDGIHLFYRVPGLNSRKVMDIRIPYSHRTAEGIDDRRIVSRHVGEVKCDPHGYVVGPGSVHPSGNKYGPLNGDSITEISKERLMDVIEVFIPSETDNPSISYGDADFDKEYTGDLETNHPFYELDADDVLPWLEPETRISHPVHGSTTGTNFMKNDDRQTFTCWRCQYGTSDGCGLNSRQFLALEVIGGQFGDTPCKKIREMWRKYSYLHYYAWRRAVNKGLISYTGVPYKVLHGYSVDEGVIDIDDKLAGELYYDMKNCLLHEMRAKTDPEVEDEPLDR